MLIYVFAFLGGLAMFLYGMQLMGEGLQRAAGAKLQKILEALTSVTIFGVLLGAGVTAILQSSSATTVMTVGLVNAGLMTLKQAFGIVMGANIGTTMTGNLPMNQEYLQGYAYNRLGLNPKTPEQYQYQAQSSWDAFKNGLTQFGAEAILGTVKSAATLLDLPQYVNIAMNKEKEFNYQQVNIN